MEFPSELLISTSEILIKFIAIVLATENDKILVEQRNKFATGDELEILSPNLPVGSKFKVQKITTESGEIIPEAKAVQQKVYLFGAPKGIAVGDILRK